MWWWKRPTIEPDLEATAARIAAEAELDRVKAQGRYVQRLSAALIERRQLNHFGDEIQITFTPKEKHA